MLITFKSDMCILRLHPLLNNLSFLSPKCKCKNTNVNIFFRNFCQVLECTSIHLSQTIGRCNKTYIIRSQTELDIKSLCLFIYFVCITVIFNKTVYIKWKYHFEYIFIISIPTWNSNRLHRVYLHKYKLWKVALVSLIYFGRIYNFNFLNSVCKWLK